MHNYTVKKTNSSNDTTLGFDQKESIFMQNAINLHLKQSSRMPTLCFATADFIMRLFAGESPEKTLDSWCANSSFLQQNNDENGKRYTDSVANKLFEQSTVAEHSLFLCTMLPDVHTFVIEKKCDGRETWYRVYQSFLGFFNLSQWLGFEKFPDYSIINYSKDYLKSLDSIEKTELVNKNNCIAYINSVRKYGDGKRLSADELHEFQKLTLDYCTHFHQAYCSNYESISTTMFNVNPALLLETTPVLTATPSEKKESTTTHSEKKESTTTYSQALTKFGVLPNKTTRTYVEEKEDKNNEIAREITMLNNLFKML